MCPVLICDCGKLQPCCWALLVERLPLLPRLVQNEFQNKPIVSQSAPQTIDRLYYYGPGTRFGASRPFDHAKSGCFLYCSEALSWPRMALNDCFFFSLLERHSRCLMMCSSGVGTGKSPDWSDFHPCRSLQSLAIAPGQSSWPELRKGDIQEEQSISRWRKKC